MTQATAPVAVITGASSGIGLAAAEGLARLGWRIIGVGRNPQRCAAARSAIAERELNVGVVTALIGAPFFLWLVVRSRREVF